ncbi:MAG: hypothetical protein KAT70_04290 [Thermoplasmata archaeon]|nr:hypothetical protein [Thermoplasmata archaeon]
MKPETIDVALIALFFIAVPLVVYVFLSEGSMLLWLSYLSFIYSAASVFCLAVIAYALLRLGTTIMKEIP